jgi:sulfite exporter TauE/SafE
LLEAFILGFGAGIAATPHCLGMCGGFPLYLAKSGGKGRAVSRQVLFVLGKSFTYVFLGVMAASLGVIVLKNTSLASIAPVLRIAAGVITLIFGLLMLGFRLPSIKPLQGIVETGFVRSLFGGLLVSPSPAAALCLGLGTGFLPCPLPMGMLAVAATSQNIFYAIALMAGVGLGTSPGLIAVGLFGIGLDRKFAKVGMRAAGIVVVAVGLLAIGRATGIISPHHPVNHAIPSCCQGHSE